MFLKIIWYPLIGILAEGGSVSSTLWEYRVTRQCTADSLYTCAIISNQFTHDCKKLLGVWDQIHKQLMIWNIVKQVLLFYKIIIRPCSIVKLQVISGHDMCKIVVREYTN